MRKSPTARTKNHDRAPADRGRVICVVDPRKDDYQHWHSRAQSSGRRIELLANAEEALRLAAADAVELWVINAHLPGLSGCDLCGMLKSRGTRAAVCIVSDEHSPAVELAALASRATLYACKPAHDAVLDQWVKSHSPVFK